MNDEWTWRCSSSFKILIPVLSDVNPEEELWNQTALLFPEAAPHCPFHSRCTTYTFTDTQKTGLLSILANMLFYDLFIFMCFSACMLMCRVHAVPTETHRESDFLELELEMVVSHHGRECWESKPYWYSAAHFCLFGKDHPKRHGLTLCKPPLQSLAVLLLTRLPGEHSM